MQCAGEAIAKSWHSFWNNYWSCCSSGRTWPYSLWLQWIQHYGMHFKCCVAMPQVCWHFSVIQCFFAFVGKLRECFEVLTLKKFLALLHWFILFNSTNEWINLILNFFLLQIDDDEKVTMIDFPQMVSVSHRNAQMYETLPILIFHIIFVLLNCF